MRGSEEVESTGAEGVRPLWAVAGPKTVPDTLHNTPAPSHYYGVPSLPLLEFMP